MYYVSIFGQLIYFAVLLYQSRRATALGFYNWGIYVGYSTAFAFNFILVSIGWRWTFRIASFPGFVVAVILFVTVKEPVRVKPPEVTKPSYHT